MLKNFSPRPYQLDIFQKALRTNTLVVLPTGLGKTAIAMMVAARRLLLYPQKKVLFLAPTKPLVEQQLKSFQKSFFLKKDEFVLFTGSTAPAKRHELWNQARCIFSTPQTIENDVLSNKISLDDVSLLIVDEAHRATGDYAYVYLAKKYVEQATHARIMALTASPGADREKINEVVKNLHIEKIEYRKSGDKEVAQFTAGTEVKWEHVILPENMAKMVRYLKSAYNDRLHQIRELGVVRKSGQFSKSQLLQLQRELHTKVLQGDKSPDILQSISLCAQAIKISHALELGESQTIHALHEYLFGILKKAKTTKTKAIKNLATDPSILSALSLARDARKAQQEHPKVGVLQQRVASILKQKPHAKIIIFSQYRDTAFALQKSLECESKLFFGQSKKDGFGLSQKEQQKVLESFRNAEFSCLIATSVAEEGLDIPSVDHVFFYEPVPSAIRSVQRRGRTGRHEKGFVTVFITKGTRDETFRWIAHHKEKRMYSVLGDMSSKTLPKQQKSLDEFKKKEAEIKIIGDFREKGSPVLKSLDNIGVDIELKQLSVGDFVLSKECCVEYKLYPDFVDSIIDGRLLTQLRSLSQYTKPVLILEGEQRLHRRIDPHAVTGMLATIALSYRIPVLRTFSPLETAQLLLALAKAEQGEQEGSFTFHTAKPLDDRQVLEYILSSIPTLGTGLSKALLEKFDSLEKVFAASVEELQEIPLIGKKKAGEIKRVLSLSYEGTKTL